MSKIEHSGEREDLMNFFTLGSARLLRNYKCALNKDLASQQWQGAFSRNVEGVLQQFFNECKAEMKNQKLDESMYAELLAMVDLFIADAVKHNRSSCALSNFPEEHRPGSVTITDVWNSAVAKMKVFI